jgi:hypothetical protein
MDKSFQVRKGNHGKFHGGDEVRLNFEKAFIHSVNIYWHKF